MVIADVRQLRGDDLLQHLGVRHQTSGSGTALLDRLEPAGFIRRIPNPGDRRSLLVKLDSERAQGAVERLKELEQIFVQESSDFTEGELRKVAEFIQDVGEITSGVRNLA